MPYNVPTEKVKNLYGMLNYAYHNDNCFPHTIQLNAVYHIVIFEGLYFAEGKSQRIFVLWIIKSNTVFP